MRTYPALLMGLCLAATPFASLADEVAPAGEPPATPGDAAAPTETSGVQPASATVPAPQPQASAPTDTPAEIAVELLDDPAAAVLAKKPWSVTVSDSIGFGLQADEDTSYYYTQLGVTGSYKVTQKILVGASTSLFYTPDPRPGDAVTSDVGGVSLSVRHTSLYKDDQFTGINVSGGLVLAIPFGLRALNAWHYPYPTVGASLNLSRKVGPVSLAYGLRLNKFNPADAYYVPSECVESGRTASSCQLPMAEMSWQLMNSLSAIYSPMDKLTLSGSFGFINGASFAPGTWEPGLGPEDLFGLYANQRGGFRFDLSALYQVTDAFAAGMSFSNGGPWRSNGQSIYNPVFDPRLAAMSIDVSYTF